MYTIISITLFEFRSIKYFNNNEKKKNEKENIIYSIKRKLKIIFPF